MTFTQKTKHYDTFLDWAVENIDKWNDKYTHLRISYNGLLDWTRNDAWLYCGIWCTNTTLDRTSEGLPFLRGIHILPQSITKQQWLDAKELKRKQQEKENMNKTFTKSDLRNGMIVEFKSGEKGIVLKYVKDVDVIVSMCFRKWWCLDNYNTKTLDSVYNRIDKVYNPYTEMGLSYTDENLILVWDRFEVTRKPTEYDILMQKIEEHQKSLAETQKSLAELKEQAKRLEK